MGKELPSQRYVWKELYGGTISKGIVIDEKTYNGVRKKIFKRDAYPFHSCGSPAYPGEDQYFLIKGGVVLLEEIGRARALTLEHETKKGLAALADYLDLPQPVKSR